LEYVLDSHAAQRLPSRALGRVYIGYTFDWNIITTISPRDGRSIYKRYYATLKLLPFEVLNFTLVLFGCLPSLESSQIPSLSGFRVLLGGV
jgi:hypothetical protein